jgi:hypothetical protein
MGADRRLWCRLRLEPHLTVRTEPALRTVKEGAGGVGAHNDAGRRRDAAALVARNRRYASGRGPPREAG